MLTFSNKNATEALSFGEGKIGSTHTRDVNGFLQMSRSYFRPFLFAN